MQKAFKLTGLVKEYKDFQLGPLNMELEPGIVLGYIGPNGSGKSTTMHCMTGLVKPNGGQTEIYGRPVDHKNPEWKHDIGYVGDLHPFYESWTGGRNLQFLSKFFPAWSTKVVKDLSKRFGLDLDKKVKALSTGNRVKLALISAFARRPKLLLLDEPTAGLDPVVRSEVLDVLFEISEKGDNAIFYSTHILSDIAKIADELAFLRDGKIILRTPKDDLTESWRRISFRLTGDKDHFEAAISQLREGKEHQVVSSDYSATLRHLSEIGAENVEAARMSIDDIAIEILKGGPHV